MNNPLNPSATVLIKLGSMIVHYQEQLSPLGHYFDKAALTTLETDPEVIEWLKQMTQLAFLPVKR